MAAAAAIIIPMVSGYISKKKYICVCVRESFILTKKNYIYMYIGN